MPGVARGRRLRRMWRHAWTAWGIAALVACGTRTGLEFEADSDLGGKGNAGGAAGTSPIGGGDAGFGGDRGGANSGGRPGAGGRPPGRAGSPPIARGGSGGRGSGGFAGSGIGGFAGGGPPGNCILATGQVYRPGESWIGPDSCTQCTCHGGGAVSCTSTEQCGSCFADGFWLQEGEEWVDDASCSICVCRGGVFQCRELDDCFTCVAPDDTLLRSGEGWISPDGCEECVCTFDQGFVCDSGCAPCDPFQCGPGGCCLPDGSCGFSISSEEARCVPAYPPSVAIEEAVNYCPGIQLGGALRDGCCLPDGSCGMALTLPSPAPDVPHDALCVDPIDIGRPRGPDCCEQCLIQNCGEERLSECSNSEPCVRTVECLFESGCGEAYRRDGTLPQECADKCLPDPQDASPFLCFLDCEAMCPI